MERLLLGRAHLAPVRLGRLLLRLPAPVGAKVVDGEVVRDAEEPGGERHLAPFEALDRLDHLHEGLVGEVLGVVLVADPHL